MTSRRNPRCPRCGSALNVEQEHGVDAQGRLDVFADSTRYMCTYFGSQHGRGCGHRWDETERAIDAARDAVAAIPVTDSTAPCRAKALAQIDELIDRRALGKAQRQVVREARAS